MVWIGLGVASARGDTAPPTRGDTTAPSVGVPAEGSAVKRVVQLLTESLRLRPELYASYAVNDEGWCEPATVGAIRWSSTQPTPFRLALGEELRWRAAK
jgi:hypothetical protein